MKLVDQLVNTPGEQRPAFAQAWALARPELRRDDVLSLSWHVARFVAHPAPLSGPDRAGLRWEIRKVWNVRPGPRETLRPDLNERLVAHYAADAVLLRERVGVEHDW